MTTDRGAAPHEPPGVRHLLDLAGRVAIVTGAGSGIGSGIAARFVEAGARVVVHYRESRVAAERLVERLRASGGEAVAMRADLTVRAEIEDLLDATSGSLGLPRLLVNNAGTYPVSAILDASDEEWRRVIDANLTAAHLATQAFARRLVPLGGGGAIVNIASIEAHAVAPSHAHYAAAKAGVVMYTRSAARELGPEGIRVNSVSPGLIWRPGLDEAWPDGVARYLRAVPLGRLGRFDDVADACLFLASDAARWITGADLVVDGGVLTSAAY